MSVNLHQGELHTYAHSLAGRKGGSGVVISIPHDKSKHAVTSGPGHSLSIAIGIRAKGIKPVTGIGFSL